MRLFDEESRLELKLFLKISVLLNLTPPWPPWQSQPHMDMAPPVPLFGVDVHLCLVEPGLQHVNIPPGVPPFIPLVLLLLTKEDELLTTF